MGKCPLLDTLNRIVYLPIGRFSEVSMAMDDVFLAPKILSIPVEKITQFGVT